MSSLHRGDERLHHCDGSHRWVGPSAQGQRDWETKIASHLEQHRAHLGPSSREDVSDETIAREDRPYRRSVRWATH